MIACSILHFEPAFEALLPQARRGNEYTKSNWIDNKSLGYKHITREASMDLVMNCSSERSLILLMNPDNEGDHDKTFGWNFINLLQGLTSTIGFRRGAPSSSVDDVFMWIEVAASFLNASMKLGTRENLRRTPGTVGGLSYFINAAQIPTSNFQPQYLARFSNAAQSDASTQPLPVGKLSKEKANKLERKRLEDKQRNIMLTKTLNAPYWD